MGALQIKNCKMVIYSPMEFYCQGFWNTWTSLKPRHTQRLFAKFGEPHKYTWNNRRRRRRGHGHRWKGSVSGTDTRRLVWRSPPTGHCCPVQSSPLPGWNWTWCRHVCPLLCILHDWGAAGSWWREGGHSCGDDHGRELPINYYCSLHSVLQEHTQQVGWRRRRISGCSNPLRDRGVGFRKGKWLPELLMLQNLSSEVVSW